MIQSNARLGEHPAQAIQFFPNEPDYKRPKQMQEKYGFRAQSTPRVEFNAGTLEDN
jgi:hypothetical protein